MALLKEVPSGSETVRVSEVMNAGTFLVTKMSGQEESLNKLQAQVDIIEMFLPNAKLTSLPIHWPPQIKELVAVKHPQTGKYHRGCVEAIDGKHCQVFLIDHGCTVRVHASAVHEIDECYKRRECLAFQIILFGIVPAKQTPESSISGKVLSTSIWSEAANTFVKEQVALSSLAYFFNIGEKEQGMPVFGDLFLETKKGYLDLRQLLCIQKFALSSVKLFTEKYSMYENSLLANIKVEPQKHSTISPPSERYKGEMAREKKRVHFESSSMNTMDFLHDKEETNVREELSRGAYSKIRRGSHAHRKGPVRKKFGNKRASNHESFPHPGENSVTGREIQQTGNRNEIPGKSVHWSDEMKEEEEEEEEYSLTNELQRADSAGSKRVIRHYQIPEFVNNCPLEKTKQENKHSFRENKFSKRHYVHKPNPTSGKALEKYDSMENEGYTSHSTNKSKNPIYKTELSEKSVDRFHREEEDKKRSPINTNPELAKKRKHYQIPDHKRNCTSEKSKNSQLFLSKENEFSKRYSVDDSPIVGNCNASSKYESVRNEGNNFNSSYQTKNTTYKSESEKSEFRCLVNDDEEERGDSRSNKQEDLNSVEPRKIVHYQLPDYINKCIPERPERPKRPFPQKITKLSPSEKKFSKGRGTDNSPITANCNEYQKHGYVENQGKTSFSKTMVATNEKRFECRDLRGHRQNKDYEYSKKEEEWEERGQMRSETRATERSTEPLEGVSSDPLCHGVFPERHFGKKSPSGDTLTKGGHMRNNSQKNGGREDNSSYLPIDQGEDTNSEYRSGKYSRDFNRKSCSPEINVENQFHLKQSTTLINASVPDKTKSQLRKSNERWDNTDEDTCNSSFEEKGGSKTSFNSKNRLSEKKTIVRTYFPAGFNMSEADSVFSNSIRSKLREEKFSGSARQTSKHNHQTIPKSEFTRGKQAESNDRTSFLSSEEELEIESSDNTPVQGKNARLDGSISESNAFLKADITINNQILKQQQQKQPQILDVNDIPSKHDLVNIKQNCTPSSLHLSKKNSGTCAEQNEKEDDCLDVVDTKVQISSTKSSRTSDHLRMSTTDHMESFQTSMSNDSSEEDKASESFSESNLRQLDHKRKYSFAQSECHENKKSCVTKIKENIKNPQSSKRILDISEIVRDANSLLNNSVKSTKEEIEGFAHKIRNEIIDDYSMKSEGPYVELNNHMNIDSNEKSKLQREISETKFLNVNDQDTEGSSRKMGKIDEDSDIVLNEFSASVSKHFSEIFSNEVAKVSKLSEETSKLTLKKITDNMSKKVSEVLSQEFSKALSKVTEIIQAEASEYKSETLSKAHSKDDFSNTLQEILEPLEQAGESESVSKSLSQSAFQDISESEKESLIFEKGFRKNMIEDEKIKLGPDMPKDHDLEVPKERKALSKRVSLQELTDFQNSETSNLAQVMEDGELDNNCSTTNIKSQQTEKEDKTEIETCLPNESQMKATITSSENDICLLRKGTQIESNDIIDPNSELSSDAQHDALGICGSTQEALTTCVSKNEAIEIRESTEEAKVCDAKNLEDVACVTKDSNETEKHKSSDFYCYSAVREEPKSIEEVEVRDENNKVNEAFGANYMNESNQTDVFCSRKSVCEESTTRGKVETVMPLSTHSDVAENKIQAVGVAEGNEIPNSQRIIEQREDDDISNKPSTGLTEGAGKESSAISLKESEKDNHKKESSEPKQSLLEPDRQLDNAEGDNCVHKNASTEESNVSVNARKEEGTEDSKGKDLIPTKTSVIKKTQSVHNYVKQVPFPNIVHNHGRKIMDQLQLMLILLHGAPTDFKPLNSVAEAEFQRDIHEVLKLIMNRLMRMQKHAWPLIQQGYSLVMVCPQRSGKTLGYAVPVMNSILQSISTDKLPKGNGPVALVLCSGARSCNKMWETFAQFRTSREVKILSACGGGGEKIEFKLLNGCHVLISTPRCFTRLLALGEIVLNFLRLKYLILDDADVLTLRFLPEVEVICRYVNLRMRPQEKEVLQVIAAAEKWCPGLDMLVRKVSRPVVCIGAFLEALVYARLKPHVHFVNSDNRITTLRKILQEAPQKHHTIIACRTVSEVNAVAEALESFSHLLVVHEDMDMHDIHESYLSWSYRQSPILVCTDVTLQEMRFQEATQLIHFNLADISKREFALRCSTLIVHLPSVFASQEEKQTALRPEMHMLISNADKKPLPTLVRLLKRLGVVVDPDLCKRAMVAEIEKELQKNCVPLCYNTKAFGDCWNRSQCIFRHVINDKDKPNNIPVNGMVKLRILYIHDACFYSARILEHTDETGKVSVIQNHIMSIARKLRAHFKDEENRIPLAEPKAYDLCVAEKPQGIFQRAEVLSYVKMDKYDNPTELLVRFIDDGCYEYMKVTKLYVIPDDLKSIPPQSVHIFLARLIPCDLDWSWGLATNQRVEEILTEAESEGRYLIGTVRLSLRGTLWLDPLECYQKLPTLKTNTIVYSLRRRLLEEKLAVENTQHLNLLYKACTRAGLEVDFYTSTDSSSRTGSSEEKVEVSWAHLPTDEFSLVYFIVGDNPSRFYIRQKKFEDLVHKLDNKLDKYVKGKKSSERTLFTGDYCVGKFPVDGRWYRASIESAQEDHLDLFFVDHGDRATVGRNEVYPLPNELITQLPFQAIECCLAGIGPDLGDRWSEESIDALFNITAKPGTVDAVKLLYAKVLDKKKPADCTGGYKYHIALIEVTPHGKAVLNDTLVVWGLATQSEKDKELLSSIELADLNPPVESSEEEWSADDEDEGSDTESPKKVEILFEDKNNFGEGKVESPLVTENGCLDRPSGSSLEIVPKEPETNSETFMGFDFSLVSQEEVVQFYQDLMANYKACANKKSHATTASSHGGEKHVNEEEINKSCPLVNDTDKKKKLPKPENTVKDEASSDDAESGCLSTSVTSEGVLQHTQLDLNPVDEDGLRMPLLKKVTRTPLIFWRQNGYFVWLRVDLSGVDKYYLKWDIENLHFWTLYKETIYSFDLHLFGPINPETLKHSGGVSLCIKMQKVFVGFEWPHLISERTKLPWIKREYDETNDSDLEEQYLADQLQALQEMEKKKESPKQMKNILPADEEPYEDDSDDTSTISDHFNQNEELYDLYDPMD